MSLMLYFFGKRFLYLCFSFVSFTFQTGRQITVFGSKYRLSLPLRVLFTKKNKYLIKGASSTYQRLASSKWHHTRNRYVFKCLPCTFQYLSDSHAAAPALDEIKKPNKLGKAPSQANLLFDVVGFHYGGKENSNAATLVIFFYYF